MSAAQKTDVLIVGAGPVGMMTALLFAQRGVEPMIIDSEWRTGTHSYALALHPASLALLDDLGLADQTLAQAYRVERIALYDGSMRRDTIELSRLGGDFPFLAVLRQDALEDLLERRLAALHVKVRWNHRLTRVTDAGDHVDAVVARLGKEPMGYAVVTSETIIEKSIPVRAKWVIGADGHRSAVRQALGASFDTVGRTDHFAVFEFATDAELEHELRLVLHSDSLNVLWPMPDGHCRWSFQLKIAEADPASRVKARLAVQVGEYTFPVLTSDELCQFLQSRAPWFRGSVGDIRWSMAVRFERRLASSFGNGRLWLAGDAAHMTGPAGVQSMNAGLHEGHELASRITQVLRGSGSPNLLLDYAHQRRMDWRRLLAIDETLDATDATPGWLRPHASELLACLPGFGETVDKLASQLGLRFVPGAGACAATPVGAASSTL